MSVRTTLKVVLVSELGEVRQVSDLHEFDGNVVGGVSDLAASFECRPTCRCRNLSPQRVPHGSDSNDPIGLQPWQANPIPDRSRRPKLLGMDHRV
jgi:hypothetical protein